MAERPIADGEQVHTPAARSIREIVFGVNDGLVSTTGLIVGVTASHLGAHQIVVAGLAAVAAAMVAMGLGAYLATAAQNEYFLSERDREIREIRQMPETERKEVEAIYRHQGFSAEQVRWLADHTTANHERWLDFMMKEELGIFLDRLDGPWRSAWVMAIAVVVGSLPPLLPFLLLPPGVALFWAIGLAMATAFSLGAVKARVGQGKPWRSGGQFVAVTVAAVVVGLVAGHLLAGLAAS